MQLTKYFDRKRNCWVVRYGEMVEYFNHGHENPIQNKRNAEACFKLLKEIEAMQQHLIIN